jgi:predicted RNase H-like HicB family nuclease
MKRKRTEIGPFTAVIQKRGRWYVAFVEEIPGVNTQGRTLAAARRNLKDSLRMVLDANRELTAKTLREDRKPSRSPIVRELVTV